ncbi:recombinase family protein [Amycolatopsis lurida]
MDTTPQPGHRPRRVSRRNDPVLYPVLRDRDREPETPGRWQRLREYLAECLTARYEDDDWRLSGYLAVRRYQCELAWRSRSTLRQRTRDGWWLGPAPYGYALEPHWVEPESARAGWRYRLLVDALRAPVVPLIFAWSVQENLSDRAIAQRLTEQQHPRPLDPASGRVRAWNRAVVRTILANPVYLGYVVRDRTAGGVEHPPECWTWSRQRSHRALVEPALFWTVYNRRARWVSPTPDTDPTGLTDQGREAA